MMLFKFFLFCMPKKYGCITVCDVMLLLYAMQGCFFVIGIMHRTKHVGNNKKSDHDVRALNSPYGLEECEERVKNYPSILQNSPYRLYAVP